MDTQKPIRIVVVDDHAMLRKGLGVFLKSYPDLQLVGEAANGKEALEVCSDEQPDIVLMDLLMPIMDGVKATKLILETFPNIRVIVLTSFGEENLIKDVLKAGAISYLFKKTSADDLAKAIHSAYEGNSTFAPEVTDILVRSVRQPTSMFDTLTPREAEVLEYILQGLGNKEISEELVISTSTTKNHVSNILAKFGVASRTEVIVMMLEHNISLGAFYIK